MNLRSMSRPLVSLVLSVRRRSQRLPSLSLLYLRESTGRNASLALLNLCSSKIDCKIFSFLLFSFLPRTGSFNTPSRLNMPPHRWLATLLVLAAWLPLGQAVYTKVKEGQQKCFIELLHANHVVVLKYESPDQAPLPHEPEAQRGHVGILFQVRVRPLLLPGPHLHCATCPSSRGCPRARAGSHAERHSKARRVSPRASRARGPPFALPFACIMGPWAPETARKGRAACIRSGHASLYASRKPLCQDRVR